MATTNLLDMSQSFMTPDTLNKLSGALGQSSDKVKTGLKAVLPAFIMGLVNKGSTTEGAESLVNMVKQKGFDSEQAPTNFEDENYLRRGNEAVNGVLGPNVNTVVSNISTSTGMNSSSIAKMMGMVAPVVMGVLGSKIKREGMNASGVSGFLNQQKSTIANYLPTGLSNIFGGSRVTGAASAVHTSGVHTSGVSTPRTTDTTRTSSYHKSDYGYIGGKKNSKLWGILGLLAVLAVGLILWMVNKNSSVKLPEVSVPNKVEQVANKATTEIKQVFATPATSLNDLSTFMTSGASAELPKRFRFDYLTFDTGTTSLSADATNEINTIAGALKANPNAKARLEGFTDSTGEASANVQLSTERAAAVKDLLVSRGIASERIEVVGRGADTPLATNETDVGRAQNRRIEFVVTNLK